jgi:hypothetical protein
MTVSHHPARITLPHPELFFPRKPLAVNLNLSDEVPNVLSLKVMIWVEFRFVEDPQQVAVQSLSRPLRLDTVVAFAAGALGFGRDFTPPTAKTSASQTFGPHEIHSSTSCWRL